MIQDVKQHTEKKKKKGLILEGKFRAPQLPSIIRKFQTGEQFVRSLLGLCSVYVHLRLCCMPLEQHQLLGLVWHLIQRLRNVLNNFPLNSKKRIY